MTTEGLVSISEQLITTESEIDKKNFTYEQIRSKKKSMSVAIFFVRKPRL